MAEEEKLRCAACTYRGTYNAWDKIEIKRANPIPIHGDEVTLLICPACSTIRSPQNPRIENYPDHN